MLSRQAGALVAVDLVKVNWSSIVVDSYDIERQLKVVEEEPRIHSQRV